MNNNEIQEIKNQLNRIEAIISKNSTTKIPTDIDLSNRCSCGSLMVLFDASDKNCFSYKCPACGSMKSSYKSHTE